MLPTLFILNSSPNFKTIQISIEASKTTNHELVSYSKTSSGVGVQKKDLEVPVIDELYRQLWKGAGQFSAWPNDIVCLGKEAFVVTYGKEKRQICTSPKQKQALHDFEASVALILKD